MTLHRCTDAECPHIGQRTNKGCLCHKSDEQVLTEQRDTLLGALEPFEREFRDMGLGDHLADDKLMLDADSGGEILTVGHWRKLMAAIALAKGTPS